mmetsp:Transcript_12055/g.22569  ORF Transcript_12055/g.22569 Transcript_12055/m.22569 type:complete len:116 (+) Transcript_12055:60-407(+)
MDTQNIHGSFFKPNIKDLLFFSNLFAITVMLLLRHHCSTFREPNSPSTTLCHFHSSATRRRQWWHFRSNDRLVVGWHTTNSSKSSSNTDDTKQRGDGGKIPFVFLASEDKSTNAF